MRRKRERRLDQQLSECDQAYLDGGFLAAAQIDSMRALLLDAGLEQVGDGKDLLYESRRKELNNNARNGIGNL